MAKVRRSVTPRQQKLAHNIIKNSKSPAPLNKRELLVSSGYSEITAQANPQDIIDQKGVQIALKDLGFTEDNAKRVVGEILLNDRQKARDRLTAAEQVFKVHGSYAPEKRITASVDINELHKEINEQIARFRALKSE